MKIHGRRPGPRGKTYTPMPMLSVYGSLRTGEQTCLSMSSLYAILTHHTLDNIGVEETKNEKHLTVTWEVTLWHWEKEICILCNRYIHSELLSKLLLVNHVR